MYMGRLVVTCILAIDSLSEGQMINPPNGQIGMYDQFPQTGIGQGGAFPWYDPVDSPSYWNPLLYQRPPWGRQNLPQVHLPIRTTTAPPPSLQNLILPRNRLQSWLNMGPIVPPQNPPPSHHVHVDYPGYGHPGSNQMVQPLSPGLRPNRPIQTTPAPLQLPPAPLLPQTIINQPRLPSRYPTNQEPIGNRPLSPGPPISQQDALSQMMIQLRQLLSSWFQRLSRPPSIAAQHSQPSWRPNVIPGTPPSIMAPTTPEFLTIDFANYRPNNQSVRTFEMRMSYTEHICNTPTVKPQIVNPFRMLGPPVTSAPPAEPMSCQCMDFMECESQNNVYFNKKTAAECAGDVTGYLCCCEEPRLQPLAGK